MTPNYFTLSLALLSVMDHFGWTEFAFIYSGDESAERCPRAVFDNSKFTISFSTMWRNDTEAEMRLVLSELSQRARIVVLCSSTPSIKRKLLLLARDMGMISDEYAYIISDLGTAGYISDVDSLHNRTIYVWEDQNVPADGRDKDAFEAFQKTFVLSDVSDDSRTSVGFSVFSDDVQKKMKQPPFSCGVSCDKGSGWKVSLLAGQLHDAFVMDATVVNQTLAAGRSYRDGSYMFNQTAGIYEGLLANITIAWDGARIPVFSFFSINHDDFSPLTIARVIMDSKGENAKYESTFNSMSEATVIWHGKPAPKSVPDCGFKGCPPLFIVAYGIYVYSGIGVACLLVAFVILIIIHSVKARAREIERLDTLWKIPYATLRKVTHKQSSFTSNLSEASSKNIELKSETEKMCFFYYGKEPLMGFKHQAILKYEKFVNEEFRKMRQLEHDNVNRFFGVSMDSGLSYTLWRYCARGTLQ
ncbi:hypothetical protein ANCDUO_11790, partial [Ancylostoma duodenale]